MLVSQKEKKNPSLKMYRGFQLFGEIALRVQIYPFKSDNKLSIRREPSRSPELKRRPSDPQTGQNLAVDISVGMGTRLAPILAPIETKQYIEISLLNCRFSV